MPSNAEINEALHDALQKCYSSDAPLDCLAMQIGRLALERQWNESDVNEVTRKAMRMLAIVLEPPAAPSVQTLPDDF